MHTTTTHDLDVLLRWRAHPARQQPLRALVGGLIIVGLCATLWVVSGVAWGVLAFIVLTLALNRFFFPSTFVLDERAITARHPLRTQIIPWEELRRFVHDSNGGYLSRRSRPSRFDAYSGLHILWGDNPQAAIELIRQQLQLHQQSSQSHSQQSTSAVDTHHVAID